MANFTKELQFKKYRPLLFKNKNFRKKGNPTNKYFQSKIDELKILSKKKKILFKNCPICKNSKKKLLIKIYDFKYVRCHKCKHVWLENQISEKEIRKLYKFSKVDKTSRKRKTYSPLKIYWENLYEKYYKVFKNYSSKNSNLIDIGCGDGNFIEYLNKKKYFKLHATELASSEKNKLRKLLKENFFDKNIEDINFKGRKFEVITLWGVLEHLTNIDKTFKHITQLMSKKSILFFLIPNINSYAFQLLKEKTPTLVPRDHLNFFSFKSINLLTKRNNLKILYRFQELPVIDLMYPLVRVNKRLINKIIKNKLCYYDVYVLSNQSS